MKLATYRFLKESADDFEIAMRENNTFKNVDRYLRQFGYKLDELYYDTRNRFICRVTNKEEYPEIDYYPREGKFVVSRYPSSLTVDDFPRFFKLMDNAYQVVKYLNLPKDAELDIIHEEDF